MLLSEEKITKAMDFFQNKMGFSSADIARYPLVLSFSLKKRIIPRCSVIQILLAKGLLKNDLSRLTFLQFSDRCFLKRFVIKFQNVVPQLRDVYWSKTDILELRSQSEKVSGA
jgi:mTERF domain-containing protein